VLASRRSAGQAGGVTQTTAPAAAQPKTESAAERSLAEQAEVSFARWGDRPVLWFEGRWWHSGELRARAQAWAGGLRDDVGVRPGDRVVVLLPNVPEVGIAYAAAWRVGAVLTPVVFLIGGHELAHVLADSGAVVVVTSPEFLPKVLVASPGSAVRTVVVVGGDDQDSDGQGGSVDAADEGSVDAPPQVVPSARLEAAVRLEELVPRRSDELAALLYTGGTTGRAKGVMLTHAGLQAAGRSGADVSHVEGVTRTLLPLPLSHAYGLLVSVVGLHVHEPAESILMRWFDAAAFVRLVQELRPHRAAVVPAMLALLMAQPLEDFDLSSLRFIGSGGAPLSLELAQALEARLPGVTVSEGYGMTESSALLTSQSPSERRAGTVGRAVPGVEVRIVDVETGEVLPAGREGEIVARGASLMAGYWHDPDATARTVVDGWLHTGDVGVLDDDGYLRVVDRLKDLVIRGGFNVYPRDVEDALLEHPDVILAGVVGRPDPVLGEEVVAFVSLCEGAAVTGADVAAWARERVAAHKRPREVHVLDAIPLTSVGKLDRKTLRARLTQPQG